MLERLVIVFVFVFGAVTPAASQDVVLAGFTAAKTNGNISVSGGPNPMCDSEFPGSRMCTSEEIMRIPGLKTAPFAWVRPSIKGFSIAVDPTGPTVVERAIDASGAARAPADLNCAQWVSTSGSGLALAAAGRTLGTTICNVPLSVACCIAPKKQVK